MKIGIITTLDTNIGDDFIREGIIRICQKVFSGRQLEFVMINKHNPYSIYGSGLGFIPMLRRLPGINIYGRTIKRKLEPRFSLIGNKFKDCDLIIQSGAPVIWPDCHQNEWAKPIWEQTVGKLYKKIPVWNIAAGSCYPLERVPKIIDNPLDFEYIKRINSYSTVTTCRDPLAKVLFDSTGYEQRHHLIPCTAFQFTEQSKSTESNTILINYMEGGGHFDWGQNIDKSAWEQTMKKIYNDLRKDFQVIFLCHNLKEVNQAKSIDTGCVTIMPTNKDEYIAMTRNAKAAICNRLHAAVALASLGIPSISIATDTRMDMVKELGLKAFYVKEVTHQLILNEFHNILENSNKLQEELRDLKEDSFHRYIEVLK